VDVCHHSGSGGFKQTLNTFSLTGLISWSGCLYQWKQVREVGWEKPPREGQSERRGEEGGRKERRVRRREEREERQEG
jgi:hypothetical protein